MTKDSFLRLHRLYGILLSISICLAGVCLAAGCLSIYTSGEPYSRQAVADTFSTIAVPVYVCLGLTMIGFVWDWVSPAVVARRKPLKHHAAILERLTAKKDFLGADPTVLQAIDRERSLRKRHTVIRTVLVGAAIALFLIYCLQGDHFHPTDINGSVIRAMWTAFACFALPFGYAVFTAYRNEKSLRCEIDLIKQLPPLPSDAVKSEAPAAPAKRLLGIWQTALLIIGLAALIYGCLAGGTADVLAKAVNICTECIGLG